MCMKKNNNRLLRGVAAALCLALMFLTMSGMAMATDMEDAPAGDAPESTPEIVEAEPSASAAATRWSVRSIAARPLEGNAPGLPAFELQLLKHRGGGRGQWRLEWDRDSASFRDLDRAALPGDVVPVPADRPLADVLPIRKAG